MADLNDLRALCAQMKELQNRKEEVEVGLSLINADLDNLRLKLIPEMMDQMEVKNATFEGLGRVQLASDLYCSTKAGQKENAMQWLRDCGYGEMIAETYNATSMKSLVRQLIVAGTEIPEFLNVTPFIRASIVKA